MATNQTMTKSLSFGGRNDMGHHHEEAPSASTLAASAGDMYVDLTVKTVTATMVDGRGLHCRPQVDHGCNQRSACMRLQAVRRPVRLQPR